MNHLLKLGDKQTDDYPNRVRQQTILLLCQMDPTQYLAVRNRCVEMQKMPGLAISLVLQQIEEQEKQKKEPSDVVAFVSGLLLGTDPTVRQWIAFFVRSGQKHGSEVLVALRARLLKRLSSLISSMKIHTVSQETVVKSASMLRLYTALRGIAGLKFTEEEIARLMDLITSRPPVTSAGVKFVSLGLCMLIACNSLTGPSSSRSGEITLEQRAIQWINWLVDQEATFEQKVACSASFAEMLLLMAIHFHSNQLGAIGDLVFQTLGMKKGEIAIRTNSMSRIKQIFTQEVFTDKKVAYHAVRVPVTKNLSSNVTGFLPVHCIHQLLKSRAFSKYKVPIKEWVFRQICMCTTPLHPAMPALIETFVSSILVPVSSRGGSSNFEQTNEPISEKQVRAVFRRPAFVESNTMSSSTACATPAMNRSPKQKSLSRESTPSTFRLFTPSQTPNSSRSASPAQFIAIPGGGANISNDDQEFNITTQILMLYYILLYENVRLAHMKTILTSQRKVLCYSHELFADLPIKFLLQTAERDQDRFGGIFPQLLRLCSTHFPHLCLVQDWLASDDSRNLDHKGSQMMVDDAIISNSTSLSQSKEVTEAALKEALLNLKNCPPKLTLVLKKLLKMPPQDVWQFSELIISHITDLLDPNTPFQLQDLFNKVWFLMNTVFPRKLWAITVNHLNHVNGLAIRKRITQDDLVLDPLQVLRCDHRVFRTSSLLEIVLYITKACLAASRTHLSKHAQENPIMDRNPVSNNQVSNEMEREELKNALIATQESAVVQIILEAGLLKEDAELDIEETRGQSNIKEIRLICAYLHEAFIADPNLAKLVHFQGYPLQLLPIIVAGVPSMHICLDFAPELLSQPDLEKQAFAVDLISHLSIQYALPKSYSIARLAVNALSTLLSVLTSSERNILIPPVLPAMVRFCKAFPPLIEDVVGLLLQYGRICASESCINGAVSPKNFDMTGSSPIEIGNAKEDSLNGELGDITSRISPTNPSLAYQIQLTFTSILENSVLEKRIF